MANTAASVLLTDIAYDLKLSSTQATSRQAELLSYMNRVLRNGILPTLVQFDSDYGMKEWTTTETTANKREYTLPTDFVTFSSLWGREYEEAGAIATYTSTTSVTLDTEFGTTADMYNSWLFRVTSGTAADVQVMIQDYTAARVATLATALSAASADDATCLIVRNFSDDDELQLMPHTKLLKDYNGVGPPEAYCIDRDTNILLGPIPDQSTYVLYGLYFFWPVVIDGATDTMPYDPIFDNLVRQYVSAIAMNRDEYDIKVESSLITSMQGEVATILRMRREMRPNPAQSRIRGVF